ncbi:MAG: FtsQ-type POTRA domain-containing protein [Spirochaetaceae bacterium]|nr:FtsQ-type POTRA domain-containing protein [Spirochaetaceae bacterium]
MSYKAAMEYNAALEEDIDSSVAGTDEKENFKFEKPLKRILLACSILLAGELLWLFVVSPCMPLGAVDIKGLDGIPRATALELAGIDSQSSFMSVNARAAEEALSKIPLVETAEVIKHFPDSVEIVIKTRSPVAAATADVNGRTLPVFFDKDGVLFKVGADGDVSYGVGLPVISGVVFEEVTPGLRLPEFLAPLFAELQALRTNAPELLSAISEIHVSKTKYGAYDLTLYPAHNPVKIRMGWHITEDSLRYLLLLLDVLSDKGTVLDELDFRTGTASYRVRKNGQN